MLTQQFMKDAYSNLASMNAFTINTDGEKMILPDKYTLKKPIGKGTYADVYLAHEKVRTDKIERVAIKRCKQLHTTPCH